MPFTPFASAAASWRRPARLSKALVQAVGERGRSEALVALALWVLLPALLVPLLLATTSIGPDALALLLVSAVLPQLALVLRPLRYRSAGTGPILLTPQDDACSAERLRLAKLSHELRTPLNAVVGFAGLLQLQSAGTLDRSRVAEYARIIETSGEHMRGLIEEVEVAGRGGMAACPTDASSACDIGRLLETTRGMLAGQLQARGVRLVARLATVLPPLAVSRQAAQQMLLNLVSNAAKFSLEGGEIRVTVRPSRDGMARISVRDRGIGIAASDLARLGQPFARGEEARRRRIDGSGLGLSIVRSLAEREGGRLQLASAPGQGTLAVLWLPLEKPHVQTFDALEPRRRLLIPPRPRHEAVAPAFTHR